MTAHIVARRTMIGLITNFVYLTCIIGTAWGVMTYMGIDKVEITRAQLGENALNGMFLTAAMCFVAALYLSLRAIGITARS